MLQIILTLAIFLILVIPMGKYMYHIATKQKTFADKMFNPIDNFLLPDTEITRQKAAGLLIGRPRKPA